MEKKYSHLGKCTHSFFFLLFMAVALSLQAQRVIRKNDALSPLPLGAIGLEGYVGEKIDSCIKNGIMAKDYSLYLTPFRERNDDPGYFQGEFWGKWFTSAAMAYHYQPTNDHRAIIDDAARGLIETQTSDGKLSSYTKDFGPWDMWGRKYALLGLAAYYDQTGDEKALEAAARSLDNIISIAGPGKQKLTETGLSLLEALSSSSILEPVVLIYQRTGEKRYLDFAKHLVSLWSQPNAYTEDGMRLIEDALSGVDPINISSPKGYEQMSCFEGICELYRVTGEKKYLDAVVTYGHKIIEKERMIVGSGSSGELWCDGAVRQTELLEQPMETCVTVTWMKFCYQLLRLTGDPVWADEMERTLYNALLGAMVEDANWWA
ncbi:MAG: beta-L-arabinofuranosidase domain-containing protein, partial [Mariniphaga sp.]